MPVSCAAFVNYLKANAARTGSEPGVRTRLRRTMRSRTQRDRVERTFPKTTTLVPGATAPVGATAPDTDVVAVKVWATATPARTEATRTAHSKAVSFFKTSSFWLTEAEAYNGSAPLISNERAPALPCRCNGGEHGTRTLRR